MEILLKILETVFYFFLILFILNQHLLIKKHKLFYESFHSPNILINESEKNETKKSLAKNIGTIIQVHLFLYLFIGMFSSQSFLFLITFCIHLLSILFVTKTKRGETKTKRGETKFLIYQFLILTFLILIILNKFFFKNDFYNLIF